MKVFAEVQKIGKALMTPIAILPAAGLLLAFGNKLGLPMMESAGGVIFANLPLLFAIGAAVGLVGGDGVAGLAGVVALLILNSTMGIMSNAAAGVAAGDKAYAMVLGIPTLQTGVFGGLLAGIIAAICYRKFYKTELPAFLGFFAGKRLVPIMTAIVAFLVGLAMPTIWHPVQIGLELLSHFANEVNTNVSTFIFGVIERSLIPFGLHHIFYAPFWYQFGEYVDKAGQVLQGDQTIWMGMLADGVKTFNSATYQGAGKFMTGKFIIMMFGLPGAALAMYHEARKDNKKMVAGILFSAALTSFLTGVTEPLEFSFLFVAPVLYGVHCLLAGGAFMLANIFKVRIGMTFSGGLIDFIVFGVLPGTDGFQTGWVRAIIIGLCYTVIYYFVFRFAIRKWNLMTPGRGDMVKPTEENSSNNSGKSGNEELAIKVLEALGGAENIISLDACITRLRTEVKDTKEVDDAKLKSLGASGVLKVGAHGVQAIFGSKAQFICNDLRKITGIDK